MKRDNLSKIKTDPENLAKGISNLITAKFEKSDEVPDLSKKGKENINKAGNVVEKDLTTLKNTNTEQKTYRAGDVLEFTDTGIKKIEKTNEEKNESKPKRERFNWIKKELVTTSTDEEKKVPAQEDYIAPGRGYKNRINKKDEEIIQKANKSFTNIFKQIAEKEIVVKEKNKLEDELVESIKIGNKKEIKILNEKLYEKFIKKEIAEEKRIKTEKQSNSLNSERNEPKPIKTEIKEDISDEEYENFVDNNKVSEERLRSIAEKYRKQAIFQNKTSEIEKIFLEVQKGEKTPEVKIIETKKEESKKEENPTTKFDTQKAVEEIKIHIAKEEGSGKKFTQEEKQELAREMYLKAKENFQDKVIENSPSNIKNILKKTEKWWSKDLEKNRWSKTAKIAMSAALIGSATMLTGAGLGIAPSLIGAGTRVIMRVGIATGLNMAMTSNLTQKFFNIFKKEKTEEDKNKESKTKKFLKKYATFGNIAMASGIGAAFLLGGPVTALIAGGGIIAKKATNYFFDKKIKELEEKMKNLSGKIETKSFDDNYDVNKFAENLDMIGQEYDRIAKSLSKFKWGKSITNGALTMGAGLATLATFSHEKAGDLSTKGEHAPAEATASGAIHPTEHPSAEQQPSTEHQTEQTGETHPTEAREVTESKGIQEFMKTNSTKDAIKLGMYNPGNEAESMIVDHGPQSTITFDDGHGHKIEVEYSSKGAIQTIENLKAKMIEEYGDASKIPEGTLSTHYTYHGVEHDQTLIKGDVVEQYKGDMFDSNKNVENTNNISDEHNKYALPPQEDAVTGENIEQNEINLNQENNSPINDETSPSVYDANYEKMETINPIETKHIDNNVEIKNENELIKTRPEEIAHHPRNSMGDVRNMAHNYLLKNVTTTELLDKALSHQQLEQVNIMHENNINHIFPNEENTHAWYGIKDSHQLTADKILHTNIKSMNETYKPLILHFQKLHEVTGLEPIPQTAIQIGETPNEYLLRCEKFVILNGLQDKIKL